MQGMAPSALTFEPAAGLIERLHQRRYAVFESLQKVALAARDMGSES
jgi:hypothetical protein